MNKMDLRVKKTYKALFEAFLKLLESKTFEEIKVTELCDLAMVRTATFYKHFSDKYEFCSFMIQSLREQYLQKAALSEKTSSAEYYITLMMTGLRMIQENEVLIKACESDAMMAIIMESVRSGNVNYLIHRLQADQKAGHPLIGSPEFTAELLMGTMNQLSRWWIKSRDSIDLEEWKRNLSEYVRRVIG